jgi:hypothetical protein
MQAMLFISAEAMTTVNAIKELDYYSRVSLSDQPETDLTPLLATSSTPTRSILPNCLSVQKS